MTKPSAGVMKKAQSPLSPSAERFLHSVSRLVAEEEAAVPLSPQAVAFFADAFGDISNDARSTAIPATRGGAGRRLPFSAAMPPLAARRASSRPTMIEEEERPPTAEAVGGRPADARAPRGAPAPRSPPTTPLSTPTPRPPPPQQAAAVPSAPVMAPAARRAGSQRVADYAARHAPVHSARLRAQ